MEEQKVDGRYTYVVWRGIPVIVGEDIDAKQARENYSYTVKTLEREKLGSKWTRSLDEFHRLQTELSYMEDASRLGLIDRYEETRGKDSYFTEDDSAFFEEPTFTNFERLMLGRPDFKDDAELVVDSVNLVRSLFPKKVEG